MGERKVANTDDREPWSMWENLPENSKLAIHLGIVQPIDCPECDGTGARPTGPPTASPDILVALGEPSTDPADRYENLRQALAGVLENRAIPIAPHDSDGAIIAALTRALDKK